MQIKNKAVIFLNYIETTREHAIIKLKRSNRERKKLY